MGSEMCIRDSTLARTHRVHHTHSTLQNNVHETTNRPNDPRRVRIHDRISRGRFSRLPRGPLGWDDGRVMTGRFHAHDAPTRARAARGRSRVDRWRRRWALSRRCTGKSDEKEKEKSCREDARKSARALAREGWRRRASDGRAEDAATVDGSARIYTLFSSARRRRRRGRSFVS